MFSLPKSVDVFRFICWKCRQTKKFVLKDGKPTVVGKSLKNVRDKFGFKTENYVCTDCEKLKLTPPANNMSRELLRPKQVKDLDKNHN